MARYPEMNSSLDAKVKEPPSRRAGSKSRLSFRLPRLWVLCLSGALSMSLLGCREKETPSSEAGGKDNNPRSRGASETKGGLKLSNAKLAGVGGPRPKGAFSRGETILCRFDVTGFSAPKSRLHLVSRLKVKKGDGEVILAQGPEKVIDSRIPEGKSTRRVQAAVKLDLSPAASAEEHTLLVTLKEVTTGRQGTIEVPFKVRGRHYTASKRLSFNSLSMPPSEDLRPGGPVKLAINLAGFTLKDRRPKAPAGRPRWQVHLRLHAELQDAAGKTVHQEKKVLARTQIPFKPKFLPLGAKLTLPKKLPSGAYYLTLTVNDKLGETSVSAKPKIKIAPAGFGVYGVQIRGPGGVARNKFFRGEWLTVQFQVWGSPPPESFIGGVALRGPRGGVYLLKKKAFRYTGRKEAPSGSSSPGSADTEDSKKIGVSKSPKDGEDDELVRRYAIPIRIPEFVPRGKFHVHIRVADEKKGRRAERSIPFEIEGKKISPLPRFQMSRLDLRTKDRRRRPLKSRLKSGKEIHVGAVVGGMKLSKRPGPTYDLDMELNLYLRDVRGKLLHESKKVAQIKRRLTFPPLRLRLGSVWRVPDGIRGVKLLQVEVVNRLTDQVTMRQRRVFIVR